MPLNESQRVPRQETSSEPREPRGFGEHTRGLSGEYAHEQGWGLNQEERTKLDAAPQDTGGGTDYEHGARDFGDEPVSTDIPAIPATPAVAKEPAHIKPVVLQSKPAVQEKKPIYVRKAS